MSQCHTTRPPCRHFLLCGAVLSALLLPGAQAVTLGTLHSLQLAQKGHPYEGRIALISAHPLHSALWTVHLAGAAAYQQAGLSRGAWHVARSEDWKFAIRPGPVPQILVTATTALSRVPLLITVHGPGDPITQQFHVPPAGQSSTPMAMPVALTTQESAPSAPKLAPQQPYDGWSTTPQVQVQSGESLSTIAVQMDARPQIWSFDQVMHGLVVGNTQAFWHNDPNDLYAGAVLQAPSTHVLSTDNGIQAKAWLHQFYGGWDNQMSTPAASKIQKSAAPSKAMAAPSKPRATRMVLESVRAKATLPHQTIKSGLPKVEASPSTIHTVQTVRHPTSSFTMPAHGTPEKAPTVPWWSDIQGLSFVLNFLFVALLAGLWWRARSPKKPKVLSAAPCATGNAENW